jgi:vacuolar-type H+-ATPase subunit H
MSDILEKLLGVEKNASVLISEADGESNRRKTTARMDAQKRYVKLLAERAAELDSKLVEARNRLSREREEKNKNFSEDLRKRKLDGDALRRVVIERIGKAQ